MWSSGLQSKETLRKKKSVNLFLLLSVFSFSNLSQIPQQMYKFVNSIMSTKEILGKEHNGRNCIRGVALLECHV